MLLELLLLGSLQTQGTSNALDSVRALLADELWEEGRTALRVASEELPPGDPAAWVDAARLAEELLAPELELRLWSGAERASGSAASDDRERVRARLGRARALAALGRDQEAIPLFESVVDADDADRADLARALLELVGCYLYTNDDATAAAFLDRAEIACADASDDELAGELSYRRWQLDDASGRAELESVVARNGGSSPRRRLQQELQLVGFRVLAGDVTGARARFQELEPELRERAASDPLLQARRSGTLGVLLWTEGDAEGSRDELARCEGALAELLARDDPRLAAARQRLAVACRGLEDWSCVLHLEDAVVTELARHAPLTDPRLIEARTRLARAATSAGRHDLAAEQETLLLEAAEELYDESEPRLHFARNNLATSLWELGERERALRMLRAAREALEHLLPATDSNVQGGARTEARMLTELLRPGEAVPVLRDHVARLATLVPAHDDGLVRQRLELVGALQRAGDGRAADEALRLVFELDAERRRALPSRRLLDLAALTINAGHFARAEGILEEAHASQRARGASETELEDTRLELLGVRISLGRAAEVEPELRAMAARIDARGDLPSRRTGSVWSKLGRCLQSRALYAEALPWLERAIGALAPELAPTQPALLSARFNAIECRRVLGDLEGAHAELERIAEAIAPLGADHPLQGRLLAERASLAFSAGRLDEALTWYRAADELLAVGYPADHPTRTALRGRFALLLEATGSNRSARSLAEENLRARRRRYAADHPLVLNAMMDVAVLLDSQDPTELDRSIELLEQVLRGLAPQRPEDAPDVVSLRANLGARLSLRDGVTDRALDMLRSVVELREGRLPEGNRRLETARANHALALHDRGDPEPARTHFRRAWRRCDPSEPRSWHTGKLLVGVLDRPEDELERLEVCRSLTEGVLSGSSRRRLQRSQRELAELGQSAAAALGAVDFASTHARAPEVRRELVELAFVGREAVRGGAAALARASRARPDDEDAARMRRELLATATELARLVDEGAEDDALFAARRERDRLERSLQERAGRGDRTKAFSTSELAATLGPNQAYVQWFVGLRFDPERVLIHADRFGAYVLRSDGALARVDLGDANEVFWAAVRWSTAVSGARSPGLRGLSVAVVEDAADERALGAALRELVLDPLLPHLDGVSDLLLAPDQQLVLPLDALPWERGRVGDRWSVAFVSGLWELALETPPTAADRGLLVVGGIDYAAPGAAPDPEGRFEPLPATLVEIDSIAALHERLAPGATRVRRTGAEADRGAVLELLPGSRTVHLATHAWHSDRPRRPVTLATDVHRLDRRQDLSTSSPGVLSGLALAGADHDRSALVTAEELSTLDLSACELAVLSACEGAFGVVDEGVAFHSLQTALRRAGARTVVAASWPVPDEPTRLLMEAFYRGLWQDGLDAADALWEAKRILRARRDEVGDPVHPPSHWAAWMLAGRPRQGSRAGADENR